MHRSCSSTRPGFWMRMAVVALGVLILAGGTALPSKAQQSGLPDLGGSASASLTPAEERRIGERLLREVRRVLPTHEDAELQHWLDNTGRRLATAADASAAGSTFLLIADDSVNAFAMPGGVIGVHAGLVGEAEAGSELAGVMAHEIAHVTQRHIARMFARGQDWSLGAGLAILGAILAASIDPQLGQAALAGGLAANLQAQINFTRANESEADRVGAGILARAGFDPEGLANFFERLQTLERLNSSGGPEYLRTHPVTLNRITEARAYAAGQNTSLRISDDGEFSWFKARMQALSNPQRWARYPVSNRSSPEQHYRLAVALVALGRADEARAAARRVDEERMPTLTREMLRFHLLFAENRLEAATEQLQRIEQVYTDHPVVTFWMAETLSRAGAHAEALRAADRAIRLSRPISLNALRLKARIADKMGRSVLAAETMGLYFFERGQYTNAVRQYEVALASPDATVADVERIEDRRSEARRIQGSR